MDANKYFGLNDTLQHHTIVLVCSTQTRGKYWTILANLVVSMILDLKLRILRELPEYISGKEIIINKVSSVEFLLML